jgi:hypothetical protein
MDNRELLKAIKEMMETQIGSIAAIMKSMKGDMKANQVKADPNLEKIDAMQEKRDAD